MAAGVGTGARGVTAREGTGAAAHLAPVLSRASASLAGWKSKKGLLCSLFLQILQASCLITAPHMMTNYNSY